MTSIKWLHVCIRFMLVFISVMFFSSCDDKELLKGTRISLFAVNKPAEKLISAKMARAIKMLPVNKSVDILSTLKNDNPLGTLSYIDPTSQLLKPYIKEHPKPVNKDEEVSTEIIDFLDNAPNIKIQSLDLVNKSSKTIAPLIQGKNIYNINDNMAQASKIEMVDNQMTLKPIWSLDMNQIKGDDNISSTKEYFVGHIIHGDLIYYTTNSGYVVAVNLKTGKIDWKVYLQEMLSTSPVIAKNYVIVQTNNGSVINVDRKTRKVFWKYFGSGNSAMLNNYLTPLVKYGFLFTSVANSNIVAMNLYTGDKYWESFYIPTENYGKGSTFEDTASFAPIILGNKVIFANYNAGIKAVDMKSGETIWEIPGGVHEATQVGQYIVALNKYNQLMLLDANKGKVIWRRNIDTAKHKTVNKEEEYNNILFSNIIVANDKIFISSQKTKRLLAFNVKNGDLIANYSTHQVITSLPFTIWGQLVAITDDNKLLFIK